jgi:hypothetical protein
MRISTKITNYDISSPKILSSKTKKRQSVTVKMSNKNSGVQVKKTKKNIKKSDKILTRISGEGKKSVLNSLSTLFPDNSGLASTS